MKRNVGKIFATAGVVVAVILIVILIVTAFDGIKQEDFNNDLVKGMFVTLGIIYALLAFTALALMFINDNAVKEITLRSSGEGTARASIGVVRKLVKSCCEEIEGVKCRKIGLAVDEYGVRLKLQVKVVGKDVEQVEGYIRTIIADKFAKALGFKFHTIEIQFVSLQPAYEVNAAELMAKADKQLAEKKAEERAEENAKAEAEAAAKPAATDETALEVKAEDIAPETAATEIKPEAAAEEAAQTATEIKSDEIKPEEVAPAEVKAEDVAPVAEDAPAIEAEKAEDNAAKEETVTAEIASEPVIIAAEVAPAIETAPAAEAEKTQETEVAVSDSEVKKPAKKSAKK